MDVMFPCHQNHLQINCSSTCNSLNVETGGFFGEFCVLCLCGAFLCVVGVLGVVLFVVVCLFVFTLQTHVMVILSTLQECLQFVLNFDFNFKIFHLYISLSVHRSFCLFVCLFKRPPVRSLLCL